jgi:hypothetical protein
MSKMKIIVGIVLAVFLIGLISVYFVFSMPKNLGVNFSQENLNSINTKTGISYEELESSSESSLKLLGKKEIESEFTENEITALMDNHQEKWKHYPVKNVQIKIHDDGKIELSGKIDSSNIDLYSEATSLPDKYRKVVVEQMKKIPIKPSFYLKGDLKIIDGELQGGIDEAKIGPIKLPENWMQNNEDFVKDFVEDRISKAGIVANNVNFANGEMQFDGSIPETIGFMK